MKLTLRIANAVENRMPTGMSLNIFDKSSSIYIGICSIYMGYDNSPPSAEAACQNLPILLHVPIITITGIMNMMAVMMNIFS